ncbi:glycerophosphodiester phosphodiesterase family protein [Bifidobacterium aquikefiricola]|uniref:Glycerophosphodiester phosphodiesterase family protein n=1 Tax=Bifidobacterium aquikefiricola TaxID=3059038 RepID=A0AB39U7K0_9BIFI
MGFSKMAKSLALLGAASGAAVWAWMPRNAQGRKDAYVSSIPGSLGSGSQYRDDDIIPDVPYAHRGLHDAGSGLTAAYAATSGSYVALARTMAAKAGYGDETSEFPIAPENSLAAFAAACEAGYGIELDLQLTRDGRVVVVHDANIKRVTGVDAQVADLTYKELCEIPLFPAPAKPGDAKATPIEGKAGIKDEPTGISHDNFQHVPLFTDVLELVDGRVPLIVEYKMGEAFDEPLMEAGHEILEDYRGPYVIESFHPEAVAWYRNNDPQVCRGQLSSELGRPIKSVIDGKQWLLSKLLLNWKGRPDFIAYDWKGGNSFQLKAAVKLGAIPVSWTIRSEEELEESAPNFDRFIFEAFVPEA